MSSLDSETHRGDCVVLCRGNLVVKMAPKSVTLREESELQAMLERLKLEQEEDDDEEDEEGGGDD